MLSYYATHCYDIVTNELSLRDTISPNQSILPHWILNHQTPFLGIQRGTLSEHPLLQEAVQLLIPRHTAELSSLEAGMADCRVRMVGEAMPNGKRSNSYASVKQSRPLLC